MYKSQHPESESTDIFQASEFVELDIPHASKHQITVGIDRKELITVRTAGIEIDIPKTRNHGYENRQRRTSSCNK